MNTARVKGLLPVFCFVAVTSVYSHPHVFIENSFVFLFGDDGLEGIAVTWIFDEIFSASVIMDHDRNRNRALEPNEVEAIRKNAFSHLANFNYFLHVDTGGGKIKIKTVRNFEAEIVGRRLAYRFTVPLKLAAGVKEKTIRAGCFDNTYFCDVRYAKDGPVKTENASRIACSWELVADRTNAYWGGIIVPQIVRLRFRIKDE
jgi:ABC-type uncharacterized transport system substrate-binding protein